MTSCPHCGSNRFLAEAETLRHDKYGQADAWLNVCKDCEKTSVFDDRIGKQVLVKEWQL